MGVSPRRLDGWEPAEFHETIREGGKVVGVRVTREPEFSRDDVALMVAHLELEKRSRNQLGVLHEESTDPANQFAYKARDKPLTDWAEAAVGRAQDAYYKAHPDSPHHGHIWLLKP